MATDIGRVYAQEFDRAALEQIADAAERFANALAVDANRAYNSAPVGNRVYAAKPLLADMQTFRQMAAAIREVLEMQNE